MTKIFLHFENLQIVRTVIIQIVRTVSIQIVINVSIQNVFLISIQIVLTVSIKKQERDSHEDGVPVEVDPRSTGIRASKAALNILVRMVVDRMSLNNVAK